MLPSLALIPASYTSLPSSFLVSLSTVIPTLPPLASTVFCTALGRSSHFCGVPARHVNATHRPIAAITTTAKSRVTTFIAFPFVYDDAVATRHRKPLPRNGILTAVDEMHDEAKLRNTILDSIDRTPGARNEGKRVKCLEFLTVLW